jgi:putative ABC transport system permease protein
MLVVTEVALSLALLVASALLVKGFLRLQTADFGWVTENVLTFEIALPTTQYEDDESVDRFYRELLPRLSAMPSVESVGATNILPMDGNSNTFFQIVGRETDDLQRRPLTEFRRVTPEYHHTMETVLLRGRGFGASDRPDTRPVVLINESLAEQYLPNEDAIGKQLELFTGTHEIVGVLQNTLDVDQYPRPMSFVSFFQFPVRNMSFVVRTSGEPAAIADAARAAVLELDSSLPIYAVRTLQSLIDEQQGGNTIMAKIMGVVAVIALVLAIIGVYGVMAYSVSQRTQEVGIRMALGAQRGSVLGMILRQGALLALVGVVIGIGIAALVSRSLSIFLFGVNPFDPLTFILVSTTLLAAGIAATYFPALRATRVDPLEALRSE